MWKKKMPALKIDRQIDRTPTKSNLLLKTFITKKVEIYTAF